MRALAIRATVGSRKPNRLPHDHGGRGNFENNRYFTVGMVFRFGRK